MYRNLLKTSVCTISFLVSLIISMVLYGNNNTDLINTLLGVSSFIFGIFFTYFLGISSNKFTKITEALRKDDKTLLGIYYHSRSLKKEYQEKIKILLDDYLVNELDYFLVDYSKTGTKFFKLFEYCKTVDPIGFKEENAYEQIQDLLNEALENRKAVESQLSYQISIFEWFALILFASVIVVCMFILSNGSIETSLMIATVSMGITAVLYLLYDIDNLQWKETKLIWIPLTQLFKDMNLLPYFPKKVYQRINLKLEKGKIRLATYPNAYPNFSKKIIEEISI